MKPKHIWTQFTAILLSIVTISCSDQIKPNLNSYAYMQNTVDSLETAILGGGCFWCVEAIMTQIKGVHKVVPGYAGGSLSNPTYKEVCSGKTGHAEVVKVVFDPNQICYKDLLEIFMTTHDPTTLNRQGADVGTQYRSVIFFLNPTQEKQAKEVVQSLTNQSVFENPIVTELSPYDVFYEAEPYHHDYYNQNPEQGYCAAVISPKLQKLRAKHASKLKN